MSKPYLLLTPGLLITSDRVKNAMMTDWCTLDKYYNQQIVQSNRRELLDIVRVSCDNYAAVLLQGSGKYSVEAVISYCVKLTNIIKSL